MEARIAGFVVAVGQHISVCALQISLKIKYNFITSVILFSREIQKLRKGEKRRKKRRKKEAEEQGGKEGEWRKTAGKQ
jgi:hypothetical protein